jgi:putative mRNA 3-end processing factor
MVSGWMLLRGVRRRRGFPKGFILSDHVDYPDLMQAVKASGAQRVLVTHGFTDIVARLLTERGYQAEILPTRFIGEESPDRSAVDKNLEDDMQSPESE